MYAGTLRQRVGVSQVKKGWGGKEKDERGNDLPGRGNSLYTDLEIEE